MTVTNFTSAARRHRQPGLGSKPNGSFGNSTNTVVYAVTFTLSNGNKTLTMQVGACSSCGNLAAGHAGTLKFIPTSSILDVLGQSDAVEFDTPSTLQAVLIAGAARHRPRRPLRIGQIARQSARIRSGLRATMAWFYSES